MPDDLSRAFLSAHDAERYVEILKDEFQGTKFPAWYTQMPSSVRRYYTSRCRFHSDLMGTSIVTFTGIALAINNAGSTITAHSTMTMA